MKFLKKSSPAAITLSLSCLCLLATAVMAAITPPRNLQEALEAQRQAVAQNPTDSAQLNDLGNLLALAGNLDAAEETYRRALEIAPGNSISLYNLALVLQEQGRVKEARHALQTILETDPGHAWAHYQLATLFAASNNRTLALRHYEAAFSLDRSLVDPRVNPHIVENRLVTEALLKVYVSKSPSTQAPRLYEQPGDVADLLLPATPSAVETEVPGTAAEGSERRYRGSFSAGGGGSAATSEPLPVTPEPESRVLDESTLRSPDGGTNLGGAVGWTGSGTPSTDSIAPPPPTTAPVTGSQPSVTPPPTVPGVESTGRLDIELWPISDPDSTVPAS